MKNIISLTTIPSRIKYIKPCIDRLLRQNLPIYLWLSSEYNRIDGKVIVPEFLKNSKIKINYVKDRGSITKLYPALRMSNVDCIITADDDVLYPDGWAEGLLNYSNKYKDSVIAYRGRHIKKNITYKKCKIVYKPQEVTKVNFLTGSFGVLYKKEFFSDKFIDADYFTTVDDIDISVELKKNNVDIKIIPTENDIVNTALEYRKNDMLWKKNIVQNDFELNKKFWI